MLASLRGAILNTGAVDLEADKQSDRVSHNMALATLDPLTRVIAPNPATFRDLYALAIDDTRRRLGLAPFGHTRHFNKLAVHLVEQAVIAPSVEITSHRGDRWEVVGQHAPLAPSRRDVEDRVKYVAQTRRAWSAGYLEWRHQGFNQRPFRIGQINCVSVAYSRMMAAGEFSPGHWDLRSDSQPN